MTGIAALPMYDFPEIRPATDNLWRGIRSGLQRLGMEAEEQLNQRLDSAEIWSSPDLALAQTCGFPYVHSLRSRVTLVGTPDYGILPDQPGWYNSVIVARKSDARRRLGEFAGATFAYNGADSQSGLYAIMFELQAAFGNARFFGSCLRSGAHALSAKAVIEGGADIASIDAVSWRYLLRFQPGASHLKVVATTSPCPGLPYISSSNKAALPLANAVESALDALPSADKNDLGIKGFWHSRPEDYAIIQERATLSAEVIAAHTNL